MNIILFWYKNYNNFMNFIIFNHFNLITFVVVGRPESRERRAENAAVLAYSGQTTYYLLEEEVQLHLD